MRSNKKIYITQKISLIMNTKILEETGLTNGEAKVYLALLKIGETTTGRIISEAKMSSGKIYEILDKLINKGLVSYSIKEKTKYFTASSPNRILDYLQEKENKFEELQKEVRSELPNLLSLEKFGKKGYETNLFKGIKGIRTAIFESLNEMKKNEEILAMGVTSQKSEEYNILWQAWHKERISKKILCRAIFSDKNSEYFRAFKKMKLTKVKLVENLTPSAIDIIGERVLIFTYGNESSCLSIKNKEISQSFKTFFETIWKIAKK